MSRHWARAAANVLSIGLAGIGCLTGPAAAGQSLGFAVSWFAPFHYEGEQDCPDGLNEEMNWTEMLLKRGHTAADIKELEKPENTRKYLNEILHRGRNGENVCNEPEADYLSPAWKTVAGKTGHGVNLDGTTDGGATATTCRHEKFVGADGTPAVDNQLYRVLGCAKTHRGAQSLAYNNERMLEGTVTFLIELTGVDDLQNDPEIDLTLYKGLEGVKKDSSGDVMADHTFHIATDPNLRIAMKGAIKDGVLTTVPRDFELFTQRSYQPPQMRFSSARFSLTIGADRRLTGIMAGYHDVKMLYFALRRSAPLVEKFSGFNCPGVWRAFQALADGGRDPVTGACTTISTTYKFAAVPAFLIHPDGAKVTDADRPLRASEVKER